MTEKKKKSELEVVAPRGVRTFFAELGSGLITGAADDDPSGISTYSVTGSSFGYAPLWTALFSFPLMAISNTQIVLSAPSASDKITSDVRQQIEVLVVFIRSAFAFADLLFGFNEFNTFNPLDHLVSQLILYAQPQRSAILLS